MLSSDAYDTFCERIHDERKDEPEPPYPPCCPGCGEERDCTCTGPAPTFLPTELVEKVRAASPTTRLTAKVPYERDVEIVDVDESGDDDYAWERESPFANVDWEVE